MVRPAKFLKRFARSRKGATAVEFGFVALPFLALLFATLELGLIFMVQTTLDNAVETAAREIRVGIAQSKSTNAAAFKTAVCDNLDWLGSSCASNLNIDVAVFSKFAGQAPVNPMASGTFDASKFDFKPGVGGDIILVRAFYQWTVITPLLNSALVNLGSDKRLIVSTTSFRNEPF